jgi:hypothetical protein
MEFLRNCKSFIVIGNTFIAEFADVRASAESALHCANKLMGKKVDSEREFHEKHIEGRTVVTRAFYNINQMKSFYILEEYEQALEHVRNMIIIGNAF